MSKRILSQIISTLLIFIGILLLCASIWSNNTFGIIPFEQVLFHLRMPLKGADQSTIQSFVYTCIPTALVCAVISFFLIRNAQQKKQMLPMVWTDYKVFQVPKISFLKRHYALVSTAVFLFCIGTASANMDLASYVYNQMQNSTIFEEYYQDPKDVMLTFPEERRNLIYIYLESIENTYFSEEFGGVKDVNLMPELANLAERYTSFSNTERLGGAQDVFGATFTVGSMVAQTAGIPLKSPLVQAKQFAGDDDSISQQSINNMDEYAAFLPGAYSLGDVLAENGYNQMVMFGSQGGFAGRDDYFTQHGNYEIFDFDTAVEEGKIAKDYFRFWGFEDRKLFAYAKEKITELAAEDAPFNFTMLTVDTHYPDGYNCPLCDREHDEQYSNVIACASRQVDEFVEWIQEQDFYGNTTVIIVGDHQSMDLSYFEDVSDDYVRTTYNVFINAAVHTDNVKNRQFTNMDMYPTTLAAMGVSIEGDRMGLGVNLFSDNPTLLEALGYDEVNGQLGYNSAYYNNKIFYE